MRVVISEGEKGSPTDRTTYAAACSNQLLALFPCEAAPGAVRFGVRDGFDQTSASDRTCTAYLRRCGVRLDGAIIGVPRVEVPIDETPTRSVVAPTPRGLTAEAASPRLTRLIQVVPYTLPAQTGPIPA